MARRRGTLSSLCCSASLPTNPISFRFMLFVHREGFQIRQDRSSSKMAGDVTLSGGSKSLLSPFSKITTPTPDPSTRCLQIWWLVVLEDPLSSPSFFAAIVRCSAAFYHSLLFSVSFTDEPFTSVSRRRRLLSASTGLGQTSKVQSRWHSLFWAWSLFWTYGLYSGLLSLLGCKLYLLCIQPYMACPLVLQQTSPTLSIFPGCLRYLLCHPLATPCFFSHRITGYFSGFILPASDTSSAGPVCSNCRITFVGSASAQIRRSLLTGYFSGVSLPAIKANSGCFQPRTTFVGSIVVTSQCMVTISLPVDVYVLNAFSLMALLVLVCFDISPGALSSSFKLVSLCLIYVCSYVLISKPAIRICPNKPNPFVSF
ncbi:hypothetical protein ISN45_Aa05g007480 [Arabidopsis thaliana x Arabidopsis arenosa]|uniref:Transmembrane protein n=1 Tax=Arabidopsis thaliana x Arabidopsis arenosa TaxID=1240361 RepID=A0A8T1ZI90_9BRAS|nr:hypothetical protein ISN45_Aa05g007480 [Arabidopsis thaliana x Arabidopsis arenosa]